MTEVYVTLLYLHSTMYKNECVINIEQGVYKIQELSL